MVRFRFLWRGEIKLWEAFWLFAAAAQTAFSFIFFKINLLSDLNKPKVFLAVDLPFLATLIIYGAFIAIAIWKSGRKYQGLKTWRWLSRVAAVFIVLWFGANMGIYVFVKGDILLSSTPFSYPHSARMIMDEINRVPEKMSLTGAAIQGKPLNLRNFTLNFPFGGNIKDCWPDFTGQNGQGINISIFLKKPAGWISFGAKSRSLFHQFLLSGNPLKKRILEWFLMIANFKLPYGYETMHEMYYSRLIDYSWWDLRKNCRLAVFLASKRALAYELGRVYEVKTPYLKGFLTKGPWGCDLSFIFYSRKNPWYLDIMSCKKTAVKVMSMLSSIRPIKDKNKAIEETEGMLAQKEKSPYPESLLLCSLISLKGPDIKSLKELQRLAIERHNKWEAGSIGKEIKHLGQ